jgi:hypothetical protein
VSEPLDIGPWLGRELTVELDGETYPLTIVDWKALVEASESLAAQARDLPPDEVSRFYQHHVDAATDLYDYFLTGYEEEVQEGQWIPVGVVGLTSDAESFAEESHDGVLLVDLTRDGAPVLWLRDESLTEVAPSLAELLSR